MAGVSKKSGMRRDYLSSGSGQDLGQKIALFIIQIDELDAETEAFENVRDSPGELHLPVVNGGYMQLERLSDRNLGDRVDIASTGADVADPGGTSTGRKLELDFLKV
jgi:hypothetical protein